MTCNQAQLVLPKLDLSISISKLKQQHRIIRFNGRVMVEVKSRMLISYH